VEKPVIKIALDAAAGEQECTSINQDTHGELRAGHAPGPAEVFRA
jgi:hypothetical protein